jgi:hypothetical protein
MQSGVLLGAAALVLACSIGCGSEGDPAGTVPAAGGSAGAAGAAGSAGAGPFALAPGEVAELELVDGAAGVRLHTPQGDEKFVLLVASLDLAASGTQYDYSLELDAEASGTATLVTGCAFDSSAWKAKQLPSETPPTGAGPQVGDERSLHVALPTGSETIVAQAIAVGQSAVVWADVTPAHPAVLDPADVQSFLTDFEQGALMMSNRDEAGGVAPVNPCFAYLPTASDPVTNRPRGANLFASFHGQQMSGPKLGLASAADGQLYAGGADLLALDADPGASEIGLSVSVAVAAQPRVRIGRIR